MIEHKAQNSLDELEIQTDKEIIYEEEINGHVDNIQQLIDCQLTTEEIRTISTAINHLEVDYSMGNLLTSENKSLKRINGIRSKLDKQKEMWEVE